MKPLVLCVAFVTVCLLSSCWGFSFVPKCLQEIQEKAEKLKSSSHFEQLMNACKFSKETIHCLENTGEVIPSETVRQHYMDQLKRIKKEYQEKCAACIGPTLAAWMLLLPLASILRQNMNWF